jgi:hypothetical protein
VNHRFPDTGAGYRTEAPGPGRCALAGTVAAALGLAGTALAGTALAGTALAGTALAGTALAGTAAAPGFAGWPG